MTALRRLLVLPRVAWYAARAPRGGPAASWDAYWRDVRDDGAAGDVLWDAARPDELALCRSLAEAHLDPGLPLVDVGCGNGTYALALADLAPAVLGVDLSVAAVARAAARARRAGDRDHLAFRALDVTRPGAAAELAEAFAATGWAGGGANVFVRGVLHVLDAPARRALAGTVAQVLGRRGTLLVVESAFTGGPLRYLEHLGARATAIPPTVVRCLRAGLPVPRHVSAAEVAATFPADEGWRVVTSGSGALGLVGTTGASAVVPGFHAVLRRSAPA